MALTIDQLEAHRDALETARFRGVREVEYEGERIAYKSDDQMRQALAALEKKIAALRSERPITDIHFLTSKGL